MNSEALVNWLRAMVQAMPHGGKKQAAEMLGISPSGLSKLLSTPERAFDKKTTNAIAWSLNSKAEKWPEADFPVLSRGAVGPIIVEMRRNTKTGGEFPVWKAAEPVKPRR